MEYVAVQSGSSTLANTWEIVINIYSACRSGVNITCISGPHTTSSVDSRKHDSAYSDSAHTRGITAGM
ncbi:hypothetical protein BGZ93_003859 [Podila epicladia]|nr:hypothetical protein BGZ92_010463 [Podila epicladia]KAG0100155.1 hypothetical protein BGZ93_003859 [Podila epicladia]